MTVILNGAEFADSDGDVLALADVPDGHIRSVLIEAQQRYKDEPENVEAGVAVRLNEDAMRKLVSWGQAWLDAPRDEARGRAEVRAREEGFHLLQTSLGEWGVVQIDEGEEIWPADGGAPAPKGPIANEVGREVSADEVIIYTRTESTTWCADEAAARRLFAELRGKALCETCPAEVDEGELIEAGEDGPEVCPACATELREEFAAQPFRCVDAYEAGACGWEGTGKEAVVEDGEVHCPTCGGEAVEVAPATEATPS